MALPGEAIFGQATLTQTRAVLVWHRGSSVVSMYALKSPRESVVNPKNKKDPNGIADIEHGSSVCLLSVSPWLGLGLT